MNINMKLNFMFFSILFLAGCKSVWQQPLPDTEIIYQGEGTHDTPGHVLGFIQSNGENNQILEINKQFEKPVWSDDGNFIYGLSGSTGSYMGYPAYWDLQKGRYGICNRNLPYFEQIQGFNSSENHYEVVVQDVGIITVIDLARCKKLQTIIDFSSKPGEFSIVGFSYLPARQELLFGLVTNPYTGRGYSLMYLN